MVAGPKAIHESFRGLGTPPQSPLKPQRASFALGFKQKTPPRTSNQQRASGKSSPLLHASPTMNGSMTGENSPFAMPSATAPVVGRHHKRNNSLVGFDPLLDNNRPRTPPESKGGDIAATFSTSPPSPPNEAIDMGAAKLRPEDVGAELRKIALGLANSSPRSSMNACEGSMANLHLNVLAPSEPDTEHKKKFSGWPKRKSHRRARSVENLATNNHGGSTSVFKEVQNSERRTSADMPGTVRKIPSPKIPISPAFTSKSQSPMIQDLYDVVASIEPGMDSSDHFLSIPSLAKPSPTSFLTGREIVRSSEMEPSLFQMEIPDLKQFLVSSRLVQFVEEYRKEDFNLDLAGTLLGVRRLDLQTFLTLNKTPPKSNITNAHKPVVESLLEAADDVTIQGYVQQRNCGGTADSRREAVIFERQCQFIVVFRGTTPEQQGKSSPLFKMKKNVPLTPLDTNDPSVQIYDCLKSSYMDFESRVFACLDQLTEQNPFCDVVFSGHSFGGAMASLAAFRYALARSMVRVSCQTFGSPKVGQKSFRQSANSLPNLKVMRIEHYSDQKCQSPSDGSHVGHSLMLQPSGNGKEAKVFVAYKFDDEAKQRIKSKPNFFKKERDASSYVFALEEFEKSKQTWVKDFYREDGKGVRGKDNEARNVV